MISIDRFRKTFLTTTTFAALTIASGALAADVNYNSTAGPNPGGAFDLGIGDDVNITGDGSNNITSTFTNTGGGANVLTVNLDASGDTITVGGTFTDIETYTMTQGTILLNGTISGADDLDIATGATVTINLATFTNDIDVSGAGSLITNNTVNANAINVNGATATADLSNDTINADVTLTLGTLTLANTTVNGNTTYDATGASTLEVDSNTTFNGDVDLTLDGSDDITDGGAGAGTIVLGNGDHDLTIEVDSSTSINEIINGDAAGSNDIVVTHAGSTNTLTLTGTVDSNIDSITLQTGNLTYSGTTNLGGSSTVINVGDGRTFTYSSAQDFDGTVDNVAAGADAQIVVFDNDADITAAGTVIDLGDGDDSLTLDVGTVTGDIDLGDGSNTLDINGGVFNGSITTGTGADTVTMADSTFNGTYDGGDTETITIDGGTVSFTSTISNVSDINIDSGTTLALTDTTYTGTVTAGVAGNMTLNVDNSTLSGDITFGTGGDNLNITDAGTVSGAINFGTGDDTITVNADDTDDSVSLGDITFDGADTDTITLTQGEIELSSIAGSADATFGANATVTLTDDISLNDLTLDNTTTAYTAAIDAMDDVTSITAAGTITINGSSTITLDFADSSALDIGDSFTLVTNTGGGNLASTFDFTSDSLGQFISLEEDTSTADVYRVVVEDTSDAVFSDPSVFDNPADNLQEAADAILGSPSGNTELDNLRTSLLGTSTPQEAESVIATVMPSVTGSTIITSLSLAGETSSIIDSRLASIRTGSDTILGISAGSSYLEGAQFWTQAFGRYAEQDTKNKIFGYDAHTYGIAFGVDTGKYLSDGLVVGAALAYASTDAGGYDANNTDTNIDSLQASIYGEYALGKDYFITANFSMAHNNIDTKRFNVGPGNDTATADFDSLQFGLNLAFGRDFSVFTPGSRTGIILTPKVTTDFLHVNFDDYTETGAGGVSLADVSTESFTKLDIGVLLDAEWNIETKYGSLVNPSVHAGYKYDLIGDSVDVSSAFTGGGAAFDTNGLEPDQHTFNFGTGLGYDSTDKWSVDAEYDFEFKEKYHSHAGKLRVKYKY